LFATWQRWPADKIVRRKGEGEIDFVVGFAWEQRKTFYFVTQVGKTFKLEHVVDGLNHV
jgi:hypothetical protein